MLANAAHMRLIGHHQVIAQPVRQALPEIEGQGFFEILDDCYRSRRPFVGTGDRIALQWLVGGDVEERFLDIV